MNHQEMFNAWKRRKERIEVSTAFPEQVMARVREHRAAGQTSVAVSTSLLGRIAARPWAKAAVVTLGVLFGLARIAVTLDLILRV
jgi:hypothetical protein